MGKDKEKNTSVDATETKSREVFVSRARKQQIKTIGYFVLGMLVMLVGTVIYDVGSKFLNHDPEAKKKEELQKREILIDHATLFQSKATQSISDLQSGLKSVDAKMTELTNKQDATLKKISDSLANLNKGTEEFKSNISKSITEEIKKGTQNLSNAIEEQKKQTQGLLSSVNETNTQLNDLRAKNVELEKKLQDLEKKRLDMQNQAKVLGVPSDDQKSLPHPSEIEKKGKDKGSKKDSEKDIEGEYDVELSDNPTVISGGSGSYDPDTYGIQIVMNEGTMSYSGVGQDSQEEQKKEVVKKKQDDFTVPVGVAEGVLFTGGEAKISGFGDTEDENTPVGIKLLSDMTIANGNYKQVEDCFLIGSAKGELGSNRAIIRLYKISCLFQDEKSDLYIAEGNVKGWVFDENSSLGVSGRLISKEGQIIMTSLPLTLLQAGLDYLTKSATNINILGSADVSSAISSGLSNGANQSFEKLTKIYEKYLDALTPAISFRAGRKISILFEGGQTIPLRLFKKNKGASGQSLRNTVDFMLRQDNKNLMEQIIEE